MKRVRGGNGLGDAIYVRSVVEALLKQREQIEVCTSYPKIFDGLNVSLKPFDRFNIQILAHYTNGKTRKDTNQWQDVCISAGLEPFPLQISWPVRNEGLINDLRAKAAGRPIVVVGAPHAPMARNDGFGKELLPKKVAFDIALAALEECFTVKVGKEEQPYEIKTDLSLNGSTSVTDLLDLGASCDALIGQCSFVIPIAEAFDKPLLIVWAAEGMEQHRHWYIKAITPQKVLSKSSSKFVLDNWSAEKISEGARALCRV